MDNIIRAPLSSPDNHPVMIFATPNPHTGRWDIHALIGNYASKEDAEIEAATVKRALEKAIGANFGKPQ